ncbi:MAG: SDR family NAD(P)-dependent oxidoreductase [Leptolyngbyaceae cyanobacterium CRU_2_3]|nr:SDR family NAD(P)-dependent oxidoreductase [Leptolyngbyaceae cyanobacterium CRU_2_3]
MTNLSFQGKTVLVTGGSRGIGKAIASAFAASGAKVAIHYGHQQETAEQTKILWQVQVI